MPQESKVDLELSVAETKEQVRAVKAELEVPDPEGAEGDLEKMLEK